MVALKSPQRQTVRSIMERYARLSTPLEREMFLYDAGLDSLIAKLNMGVDAATFCFQLVQTCEKAGTVGNEDAVIILLSYLRDQVVSGHKNLVDELNRILDDLQNPESVGEDDDLPPSPSSKTSKIKILFFSANPAELPMLKLDIEMRLIGEHLREGNVRDKFELILEPATRTDQITRHLLAYRPTIVHFAGHGVKESGIWLNNARDESVLLAPKILAGLFHLPLVRQNLKAIVINACWSEVQAEALSSYAKVPYVIGMNQPIPDRGAHAFASGFYRGLGFDMDIPGAFHLGRKELGREMNDEVFWDIPQLLEGKV